MDKRIQWAITKILEVVNKDFYGSITLSFQAGSLNHIKTEKTEHPPSKS